MSSTLGPSTKIEARGSIMAQCQAGQPIGNPDKERIAQCLAAAQQQGQQQGAQQQHDLTLSHLLEYSLITLGLVIALAAVLGWVVAGRSLRPVHRITEAARAASEHNLSARVALPGPRDELSELAETFDDMLDRLEIAFEGQRQFIANASHELRTPLAVIRTTVDVVLANPASTPEDLRGMGADIQGAVDHAERLIGALLILRATNVDSPFTMSSTWPRLPKTSSTQPTLATGGCTPAWSPP
jgi:signal transduction histidine kinase